MSSEEFQISRLSKKNHLVLDVAVDSLYTSYRRYGLHMPKKVIAGYLAETHGCLIHSADFRCLNHRLNSLELGAYLDVNGKLFYPRLVEHKDSTTSSFSSIETQVWNEINSIPLLTPEEEDELWSELNGDNEGLAVSAKSDLIEGNLRFAAYWARKASLKLNRQFLDLFQDASIGLIKAVDKFEIDRGNRFSTYATWWIRSEIQRRDHFESRNLSLPINKIEKFESAVRVREAFELQYGKLPSDEYVADQLNLDVGVLKDIEFTAKIKLESLETGFVDGVPIIEKLPAFDEHNIEQRLGVAKILDDALPFERSYILRAHFGLEGNAQTKLSDLAKLFGVSRQSVSDKKIKALNHLKFVYTGPNLDKLWS